MTPSLGLAPLLERFFTQRLMQQRQASPHTVSSYRDTFRRFLRFVQQRFQISPSRLTFEKIDAPLIVAFAGAGHSLQAVYADLGAVPHASRSRRDASRAGFTDLVWPTRSRVSPRRGPDRSSRLRDDGTHPSRPGPRR